jgi:hypothetical protein
LRQAKLADQVGGRGLSCIYCDEAVSSGFSFFQPRLQKASIEDRLRSAKDQLTALSAQSPPQPPAATDKKGFESLNAVVDQQWDRIARFSEFIDAGVI